MSKIVITSFTYDGELYEVHDEVKPALYRNGEHLGHMWWLNNNSGIGRFRSVARQGLTIVEQKMLNKRLLAKKRRGAQKARTTRHVAYRPGWTGHVN